MAIGIDNDPPAEILAEFKTVPGVLEYAIFKETNSS